jgi:outer membrane lipoprotein-sorting protein
MLAEWKSRERRATSAAMHRRTLLTTLPLVLPLGLLPVAARAQIRPAPLTPQDQADLLRIQGYLNSVRTLHARFLQVAPDGRTSEGQAWLERPGRMRFQYDPPAPFLLVAGHGLLTFYDSQLKQTSNIPLGSTPLSILLANQVNLLSGSVTVTSFRRLPGQFQVGLVRATSPQDGTLTLIFADPPLTLRQWVVTDAQGKQTTVTLYDVELGGTFPGKLFEFIDPRFFQNNSG